MGTNAWLVGWGRRLGGGLETPTLTHVGPHEALARRQRGGERVHAPGCLGRPENGGRHDEHGWFRPGPGKVFGVGRLFDGHGYGHPSQVVSVNDWESLMNHDSVQARVGGQMGRSGELGGW
jgi:hypothetical protein